MRTQVAVAAALAVLLASVLGCRSGRETACPVVFLSNRDAPKHRFHIFVMDSDGSDQRNLTADANDITTLSRPQFSPDGRLILYVSFRNRTPCLKLLDVNGGDERILTELTHDVPQASFSPDGEKIVFVRKISDKRRIYLLNLRSGKESCLSPEGRDEFDPSFSRDGSHLTLISKTSDEYRLVVLDLKEGLRKEIWRSRNPLREPALSPSGRYVVFALRVGKTSDLYLIRSDGRGLRPLVRNQAYNREPRFAPDGRKIVFVSNVRGLKYNDICVVDRITGAFRNLTEGLNYLNQSPVISPDGKWIFFHSIKYGDCEIYKVPLEGGDPLDLTNDPGWDQMPHVPRG